MEATQLEHCFVSATTNTINSE